MKRKEVLEQLDSLIDNSKSFMTGEYDYIWQQDITALEIAKKAVNQEYRFRFLASICIVIAAVIAFGSLVLMSYLVYR